MSQFKAHLQLDRCYLLIFMSVLLCCMSLLWLWSCGEDSSFHTLAQQFKVEITPHLPLDHISAHCVFTIMVTHCDDMNVVLGNILNIIGCGFFCTTPKNVNTNIGNLFTGAFLVSSHHSHEKHVALFRTQCI